MTTLASPLAAGATSPSPCGARPQYRRDTAFALVVTVVNVTVVNVTVVNVTVVNVTVVNVTVVVVFTVVVNQLSIRVEWPQIFPMHVNKRCSVPMIP